ncbi:hypothetical protein [Geomobilimonas luticola]|uniref:TonB C-terminal domain-containing protein n=1 Tax=Geomobilimonas luticola TaxID=1114878 RepID=A0ABS5SCH7_9BACT|nr:hypothetical protein [Geomobilimonas luticola]MBT0653070.1 hypothetical protein [Geomobilimonas luticola]
MNKLLIVQVTAIFLVIFGDTLSFGQQIVPGEDGFKSVYAVMTSGAYRKEKVSCKLSGDTWILSGPFYEYNTLNEYRNVRGKLEVRNIAFEYEQRGLYHPELRPPILREWVPVEVNGNVYGYMYVYYVDVSSGHVAEIENKIRGEIISSNPPRVKEIITSSANRAIRIPGETGRFTGGEGRAECIFEWRLK